MGKIRSCIVGCGRISTLHVLGYQENPDAEIYAVCDTNLDRAQALAGETGAQKVYTNLDEICNDRNVDMVELLVPHHLHCEFTIRLCEAGKHVSVQKPMALNLLECDRMIAAAKKAGVKLRVYENFIFYPPYMKAKELIMSGEIGEPLTIRLKMLAGSNNYGWKVDPATWAWRMEEAACGGGPLVFDDGNHKFSIARFFMGEPEKVFAFIDKTPVEGVMYTKADGSEVQFYEDAPAMITWKYKGGGKYGFFDITYAPELEVNSNYYACDERVEITGSKGVIWLTRCTGKMQQVPALTMFRNNMTISFDNLKDDWSYSFINATKDFIEAIRDDRDPILNGEGGREVLKFSLAAIQSAKEEKQVYLDDMDSYLGERRAK